MSRWFIWTISCVCLGAYTNSLQINCGRSFVPCEGDEEATKITPHRVYGVPNLPQSPRPRIPDAMVKTAAIDAQKEIDRVLDESEAKPLELSRLKIESHIQIVGHPLAAAVSEYVRLHSVNQAAKALSVPAYVSASMTKRLLLLGLREVDIVNGLDENILSSTIIGRTCHKHRNETCPPTFYRSFTGQCNNVRHSK